MTRYYLHLSVTDIRELTKHEARALMKCVTGPSTGLMGWFKVYPLSLGWELRCVRG